MAHFVVVNLKVVSCTFNFERANFQILNSRRNVHMISRHTEAPYPENLKSSHFNFCAISNFVKILKSHLYQIHNYWSIGPLVHWSIGPLVHWSIGPLVHWYIGPLIHWTIGPLFHWSIGPLVHWFIGPLVHWTIWPLVHWSIGWMSNIKSQ